MVVYPVNHGVTKAANAAKGNTHAPLDWLTRLCTNHVNKT
jgi:hypothetical protein